MQAVRSQLARVAAANVPVLINGESGTGKDIIARLIHGLSPWKIGPFVKVNCPAIPGNPAGERTVRLRKGSLHRRLSGQNPAGSNWRTAAPCSSTKFPSLICRCNRSCSTLTGRPVLPDRRAGRQESRSARGVRHQPQPGGGNRKRNLPPGSLLPHQCRESAHAGAAGTARRHRRSLPTISWNTTTASSTAARGPCRTEVLGVLQKYHWPGNIRELENLIKRYVILGHEEVITNDLVASRAGLLQSGDLVRRPDLTEEDDAASGARTGAQGHPESAATASLEPQAGGAHAEHQLSRAAVQDSRCRIAVEPRAAPAAGRKCHADGGAAAD